jgi:hypothetical protein
MVNNSLPGVAKTVPTSQSLSTRFQVLTERRCIGRIDSDSQRK